MAECVRKVDEHSTHNAEDKLEEDKQLEHLREWVQEHILPQEGNGTHSASWRNAHYADLGPDEEFYWMREINGELENDLELTVPSSEYKSVWKVINSSCAKALNHLKYIKRTANEHDSFIADSTHSLIDHDILKTIDDDLQLWEEKSQQLVYSKFSARIADAILGVAAEVEDESDSDKDLVDEEDSADSDEEDSAEEDSDEEDSAEEDSAEEDSGRSGGESDKDVENELSALKQATNDIVEGGCFKPFKKRKI